MLNKNIHSLNGNIRPRRRNGVRRGRNVNNNFGVRDERRVRNRFSEFRRNI